MPTILEPWPRKCPDCNNEFSSVQNRGQCPRCGLVFFVDGSGAFIKREKSLSEWMKFDAPMAPPTDLPGAIEHWNASGRMELLEVTDKILTTFSPLLEVQGLTKLHVEGKKYKDYSPLCKLTELTHLDIHDLKKDIQWISGLQQVSVLHFTDCKFCDLAPIGNLKNLRTLGFHWCTQISDLTPLSYLNQLEHLIFYECTKLVDLQPLTYCKQLSKLEFIDCFKLRDLKPLAPLNNLKLLRLVGSDVVDVSPLSELKSLEIRYRE